MHEQLIEILYQDDDIVIKNYLIAEIVILYKYDNDKSFRINNITKTMTKEMAEFIAPLLKCVINRTYNYAHSQGYQAGKSAGVDEIQKNVKKLLNIKE